MAVKRPRANSKLSFKAQHGTLEQRLRARRQLLRLGLNSLLLLGYRWRLGCWTL
jgi:hypothetical protein